LSLPEFQIERPVHLLDFSAFFNKIFSHFSFLVILHYFFLQSTLETPKEQRGFGVYI